MSTQRPRGYHFTSEAHWNACLLRGADRAPGDDGVALRPFSAFSRPSSPAFPSNGGFAPAVTRVREVLWRDGAGTLHRLADGDEAPIAVRAPAAIARATRLIASGDSLWAAGTPHTVENFDAETLSRRFVVELPTDRVIDLAGDGRDGILALVARAGGWYVVHVDCAGTVGAGIRLERASEPTAFTYLRREDRLVVLSHGGMQLLAYTGKDGAPVLRIATALLAPCFVGAAIAGDPSGRVFVAGADPAASPAAELIVVLDSAGVTLQEIPLAEPATGLAASRESLLVTGPSGLFRVAPADSVPPFVERLETMVLTPMLEAPDTEDNRRWLRIEARASLPAGASLEIAYAATDDAEVRDTVRERERDASIPAPRRAQLVRALEGLWSAPVLFSGSRDGADEDGSVLSVPLHDVRARYVWVAVSLIAGSGAKRPALSRLSVLYPGRTLMEHLPSTFQREEARPKSFTRALVGVLETTTQGLDADIAAIGRHIHPEHAPEPWLDYLARWLGLPWDDALDDGQKRSILMEGASIARGRGTRAGLETLLECLAGGTPRRFRVVDATADHGIARLGGGDCEGVALPAILAGLPATAARLGLQATLGSMRLPCPDRPEEDATSRFLGAIRVDVAASARERKQWEPWLSRLIAEMVPVGTRATVRWISLGALRGDRLDESLTLEDEPSPHLGTDAVFGQTRLPRAASTLPTSGAGGPILE